MASITKGIEIKEIAFIGNEINRVIGFNGAVCILNGASNTGKSFLVETIDYMLGKESIDKIDEADEYDEVKIKIKLNGNPFTIYRDFSDGKFVVYHEFLDSKFDDKFISYYKTGKPTKKVPNINDFYLDRLQLAGKEISSNLWAEKNRLTIRLLSRIIFSKEQKIISTSSPIEEGDRTEKTANRNVFKFLLTGIDDSDSITITREKEFKSETKGRVGALEEIIDKLSLSLEFPDESYDSLIENESKLSEEISNLNSILGQAKDGLSEVVNEREKLSKELFDLNDRNSNLIINQQNFERLAKIYKADIERLQSQEEAAFLLTVGHDGECSVCGNQSDLICNDLNDINLLAKASIAEISKIEKKELELAIVIKSIKNQHVEIEGEVDIYSKQLMALDGMLSERTPSIKMDDEKLTEIRNKQKAVANDIFLLSRISELNKKLQESELGESPKKYTSSDFHPSEENIDDFCKTYGGILKDIEFPGEHSVTFDYKRFDVVIGGKPRHLNGKGVRAILNSVFKIALLKTCREKHLFHPGLVVLDSPLVTYRDPLKSKHGKLKEDERVLAKSKISYRFLKYLHSIRDLAQFIIIENIDIPDGLSNIVSVQSFFGEGAGENERYGLF